MCGPSRDSPAWPVKSQCQHAGLRPGPSSRIRRLGCRCASNDDRETNQAKSRYTKPRHETPKVLIPDFCFEVHQRTFGFSLSSVLVRL